MKKLLTLTIAGICAFAFAATVDAATTSRITAPSKNIKYVENPTVVTVEVSGSNSNLMFFSTGLEDDFNFYNNSSLLLLERGETNYSAEISSTSVEYTLVDGVLTASSEITVIQNSDRTDMAMPNPPPDPGGNGGGGGEPLVLDIHQTGKITTAKNEWLPHFPEFYGEYASTFDFTGDGIPDQTEWLSENPGALLCMPQNGKITGVTELFGNLGGYANGFDKLSTLYDVDGNGIVEGEELSGIMLWIDSNRNGVLDPGELHTLESYDITKIYTDHENFVGKYETSDGSVHTMWAWWPSIKQKF